MDQRLRRYQTWHQLLGYCELSANPVGRIVLMMAGLRPPEEDPSNAEAWRKSDAICTALQITNHIQDVRRDLLERDRVYLPSDVAGFGAEELQAWVRAPDEPHSRVRYIRGVRALAERTNAIYDQGEDLPAMVGGRLGSLIGMMAMGGRATLRQVERRGCITLWKRPRTPPAVRFGIALGGLASLYSPSWRKPRTNSRGSSR
jgi:phytoene/squalene synthetase